MSKTQEVNNILNEYFKKNKERELYPIIYVSPEFFKELKSEDPLELNDEYRYSMTFDNYTLVIKKSLTGTNRQVYVV